MSLNFAAGDEDAAVAALATKVFNYARAGDTASLLAYLHVGLPVNLCNDSGDTLLMLAAYHGHPETVTALLARGAEPNRLNDRGQSPLAGAVFKGEHEVIRVLLDGGADPRVGEPSAVRTAELFEQHALLHLFGDQPYSG